MWVGSSFDPLDNAVSLSVVHWSVIHCVFAYDAFLKNNESVVKVQHAFRFHFNVVVLFPVRKQLWGELIVFEQRKQLIKNPTGPKSTVLTPKNTSRCSSKSTTFNEQTNPGSSNFSFFYSTYHQPWVEVPSLEVINRSIANTYWLPSTFRICN